MATAPPWWPPAPGWWMLAAAILLVLAVLAALAWRRRRRRRAIERMFDDAVSQAHSPSEQVAVMSELLRRAARRHDPDADRLEGDDWLRFLDDGMKQPVFAAGAGALLREGAFRRDVGETEIDGLRKVARSRFLAWMGSRG